MLREAKTKGDKIKIKYNYSKPVDESATISSIDAIGGLGSKSTEKISTSVRSLKTSKRAQLDEKALMNLDGR